MELFQIFIMTFSVTIGEPDMQRLSGGYYYYDSGECLLQGTSATAFFSKFYKKQYPDAKVTSEYTCVSLFANE